MELNEIIEEIKNRKLTAYKIAEELPKAFALTEVGINKIINGSSKNPRRRTLDILEGYLQNSYAKLDESLANLDVKESNELLPNKAGNVIEELPNGKYRIWTKKLPVKAFASYLSEFRNADFVESLEDISWVVDHYPKGRYATFESEGESMNGGSIDDTPGEADLFCRELLRHHWKDGFRECKYGWVIVHKETVVFKDITEFDNKTGNIICHSRSGLPNHPDFTINLDDVVEIWKVIKRSY